MRAANTTASAAPEGTPRLSVGHRYCRRPRLCDASDAEVDASAHASVGRVRRRESVSGPLRRTDASGMTTRDWLSVIGASLVFGVLAFVRSRVVDETGVRDAAIVGMLATVLFLVMAVFFVARDRNSPPE